VDDAAWDAVKAAGDEWKAFGIGIKTHSASRNHALSDIAERYRPNSKAERALTWASDKAFVANLLAPLTDIQKRIKCDRNCPQYRKPLHRHGRSRHNSGEFDGRLSGHGHRFLVQDERPDQSLLKVEFPLRVLRGMLGRGAWPRSQNFARKATRCFTST
jgi:hypothetical protein